MGGGRSLALFPVYDRPVARWPTNARQKAHKSVRCRSDFVAKPYGSGSGARHAAVAMQVDRVTLEFDNPPMPRR
jgi:hypothetical protein